jgi:hypothetical protein
LANAKGQMNQGQDGNYQQDHQRPECDLPVPVGPDQFNREKYSAEGREACDQLDGAITALAIRMGQQLDYDHGEQHKAETCEKGGQSPPTARFRVCGCVDLDQTERLEEEGGRKNANKRPTR